MTIAINQGYAITFSQRAHDEWTQRHRASRPQSVAEYRAAVSHLVAALPGVVTVN
jgi:hypothetical protein